MTTINRAIRTHEGNVAAAVSNQRGASDGSEIPGWNGEVVRVAFAIDTHGREIIAWVATSGGGISGEMIRDMMLDCVERRFDAIRAPQPVSGSLSRRQRPKGGKTAPPTPPQRRPTSPPR
ncbi:hypothetical protein [Elioraea sp.]|uniref:hypothetical protein n=1 Tax=Elioraea sp. TaxID=2185103 RepID=UPI0038D1140C